MSRVSLTHLDNKLFLRGRNPWPEPRSCSLHHLVNGCVEALWSVQTKPAYLTQGKLWSRWKEGQRIEVLLVRTRGVSLKLLAAPKPSVPSS